MWSLKRRSSWDYKCNSLLVSVGIDAESVNNKAQAKQSLSKLTQYLNQHDPFLQNIWNDTHNEANGNKLRTYRQFKYGVVTESYVNVRMPRHHRRLLAQLRTGSLHLEIETGRWTNTTLNERKCKLCDIGAVEDELHFITQCQHYNDLRQELYNKVSPIIPYVNLQSDNYMLTFISLLHSKDIQRTFAATVYNMWQRRLFNLERL